MPFKSSKAAGQWPPQAAIAALPRRITASSLRRGACDAVHQQLAASHLLQQLQGMAPPLAPLAGAQLRAVDHDVGALPGLCHEPKAHRPAAGAAAGAHQGAEAHGVHLQPVDGHVPQQFEAAQPVAGLQGGSIGRLQVRQGLKKADSSLKKAHLALAEMPKQLQRLWPRLATATGTCVHRKRGS